MGDDNRWEILSTWYEGKRKYVSAKCKVCEEVTERARLERISGKGQRKKDCLCTRKVRGKPIPVGTRFGKLVVISKDEIGSDNRNIRWNVQCDCGCVKSLQGSQLRSGSTNSCGCSLEEKRGAKMEVHGMTKTKEYKTWAAVKNRVDHPNASTRKWYYDKGIGISDEWRKSFLTFYDDMGPCPEGYSLDRINPEGDYCKENCRWASLELQSINKGLFSNNTSGYAGVSKTPYDSWVAVIHSKGNTIYLGSFKSKEDAINARKQAEETYWGDINE